jgi:hypothetical protein
MTPHESHLLPDGRVFPPVTPDPPAPPGQEEIVVPDVVIRGDAEHRDETPAEPEAEPEAPEAGPAEPPA